MKLQLYRKFTVSKGKSIKSGGMEEEVRSISSWLG